MEFKELFLHRSRWGKNAGLSINESLIHRIVIIIKPVNDPLVNFNNVSGLINSGLSSNSSRLYIYCKEKKVCEAATAIKDFSNSEKKLWALVGNETTALSASVKLNQAGEVEYRIEQIQRDIW